MKQLIKISLLTLLLTSCGLVNKTVLINDKGICDGLSPKINNLNDALLIDGGPYSTVAGAEVITGFDAGCYGTVD